MSQDPPQPAIPPSDRLRKIEHFVVLMLENRSYDHLLGAPSTAQEPAFPDGLTGQESNLADPANPGSGVTVRPANRFDMPFDPGHEFPDVAVQIFGPNPPAGAPAAMSGFVCDAIRPAVAGGDAPARNSADAERVMEYFAHDQIRVLSALARQFAVISSWHSSLPGPTWPNRFFIHAATSGGLTDSPTTEDVIKGYSFQKGTIYDRFGNDWRIYHDGMPQTAGITSLRLEYADPLTDNFREMKFFAADVAAGKLPSYVFIEPLYDTGHLYQQGNSMHPLNDVRDGERLVKLVYETLRNSGYWTNTMLVITFDEHGGFYDHVAPPAAVGTGDDYRYATPNRNFAFDRLGVRVPAIVVSAYTDPVQISQPVFDHTSLLATAERRFSLASLSNRDTHAKTFDSLVLTRDDALLDAPTALPDPAPDLPNPPAPTPPDPNAPLSANQQSFLALAIACDLHVTPSPADHAPIWNAQAQIKTQEAAADYIKSVEDKISARRAAAAASPGP